MAASSSHLALLDSPRCEEPVLVHRRPHVQEAHGAAGSQQALKGGGLRQPCGIGSGRGPACGHPASHTGIHPADPGLEAAAGRSEQHQAAVTPPATHLGNKPLNRLAVHTGTAARLFEARTTVAIKRQASQYSAASMDYPAYIELEPPSSARTMFKVWLGAGDPWREGARPCRMSSTRVTGARLKSPPAPSHMVPVRIRQYVLPCLPHAPQCC